MTTEMTDTRHIKATMNKATMNIATRNSSCETWPSGGTFAPNPRAGNSLSL